MIKILTGIFYSTAIILLLFCVMVYGGEFGVGHGGVPLLVLFVSVPAVAIFLLLLAASVYKLRLNENRTKTTTHQLL